MLCEKCEAFCQSLARTTAENVREDGSINWVPHKETLHKSVEELEASSTQHCSICRTIWYCLTESERLRLTSMSETVLEIAPDQSMPILKVSFVAGSGEVTLPPRMVAMYLREITSGKVMCTGYQVRR